MNLNLKGKKYSQYPKGVNNPNAYRWINKTRYTHTMGHCSGIKRNEILTHAITWMNLEDIM